jgi:ankyrin repeat protein
MRLKLCMLIPMSLYRYILFFMLLVAACNVYAQEQEDNNYEQGLDNQLIIAADKGDTLTALKLISWGARVNATTYEGVTPLMYAAQNGDTAMIRILVQHGADANMKPLNGYTALITAIRSGHVQVAEWLIRNGADIDLTDNYKVTPLMHAIAVDSFYMPDMLLYYKAAIDLSNRQGTDALMLASRLGRYEIAKELIAEGADINTVDIYGNLPLHYATFAGQTDLMDLLILNGAALEVSNSSGYTPLSVATAMNNFTAARLLIGYGADVNSRVNGSLNPLTLALNNKNDSLVKMLVNHDAKAIKRPCLNQFTIGTRFVFNHEDSQLDFSIGMSDSKYNLMTCLGFGFRPKPVQILDEVDQSLFYQYWEKRRFISLSLDKAFFLHTGNSAFSASAFAGFSEVLTFGSYRGSNENPDFRLMINPRIGWICEYDFIRLKLSYEFMNLHLEEISKGWFSVSLEFLLNRKRGNIKIPSLKWL